MIQNRIFLVAVGVGLIAFAVGRYILPSPTSGLTGVPVETLRAVKEWEDHGLSPGHLPPTKSLRERFERLAVAPDRVAEAFYQSLSVSDPVELTQRISDLLEKMDRSNWRDIVDAFERTTRESGVTFGSHWARVWCRVGQVAGDEIMDDCWKQGLHNDPTRSWQGLYGWAMRDPAAASEWLESLATADPGQHKRLLTAVVGGITLMSPFEGSALLRSLPEEQAQACLRHAMLNLVRAGGIESANRWLDEMIADDAVSAAVRDGAVRLVGEKIMDSWTHLDTADRVADWFHRYSESGAFDANLVGEVAARFRGTDAPGGLDFLDALAGLPLLEGQEESPPGLNSVIRHNFEADRNALGDWFDTHRDAPFYRAGVEEYARLLAAGGELRAAEHWRESLDP